MSHSPLDLHTLLTLIRPTKAANGKWHRPKWSARRVAAYRKQALLAQDPTWNEEAIRTARGRSPVREPHFKPFKGRVSDRKRIDRLESIEKKLKEIPKIEKAHKITVEKEKLRQSKQFKGFQLLQTPRVKPVVRSKASLITLRTPPPLPSIDADLKRIAEKKHLTSLPPHLQAELDARRAERKLADSIGGKKGLFHFAKKAS